jgi:uncharacterized protein (DUF697 family)
MFDRAWEQLKLIVAAGDDAAQAEIRRRATDEAPIVWLIGKTGAGKSSIVAAITGDSRAEIGDGFRARTKDSAIYDWPAEAPSLRFLDTRGLGEAGYDPAEDIEFARTKAHALVVAMNVADRNQASVLEVVRAIRKRHPEWPVVVAQTHLHLAYPAGANHPAAYPADESAMPDALRMALHAQRKDFEGLAGNAPRFVPLDFTLPEDGYAPPDYGLGALVDALAEAGIDAFKNIEIAKLAHVARRTRNLVWAYAASAGVSGGMPVPLVGIGGTLTTIGLMLRALAARYDVELTSEQYLRFSKIMGGALAVGVGARMGVAELAKFVPVYGTAVGVTLNAAASFSMTYGIGRAACRYMEMLKAGEAIDEDELRAALKEGLIARKDGAP